MASSEQSWKLRLLQAVTERGGGMGSKSSPADPFVAATLEGHLSLLYHLYHLCADDLDPPVPVQHHQPPSVRQDAPSEGEALQTQQDKPKRFIGGGQTKLQPRRCLRAGSVYSSGCRSTGLALLGLSHPRGVAAVTGSSAGGRCCSSLPSAPCGSTASGSARGCFCTAGCLKGLWLLGKEDRKPG